MVLCSSPKTTIAQAGKGFAVELVPQANGTVFVSMRSLIRNQSGWLVSETLPTLNEALYFIGINVAVAMDRVRPAARPGPTSNEVRLRQLFQTPLP